MIKTFKHLAFTLKVMPVEIKSILENIDTFYHEKKTIKSDKNGEPKLKNGVVQIRTLNPSLRRLKVIQKRININILQQLELPDYAFGGVRKKSNILNAKKHQGKKFIFTTDLKNFFPSISHLKVYEMFISFNFSPSVSRYLTKLTTYKGKLPQGAPTSTMIANLVFVKTGKKLQEFAKDNRVTFTSLVDDLTFSSPIDFKKESDLIISILIYDGFKISHNKTNYKTKRHIVTGIVVKNNSLGLTDEFKQKMFSTSNKSDAQKSGHKNYADQVKIISSNKYPQHNITTQ